MRRRTCGPSAALVLALGACRGAPPAPPPAPLLPPGWRAEREVLAGTSLSGALPSPAPAEEPAARSWSVRVRLVALEHAPAAELLPLAGRSELVLDLERVDPLVATLRLLGDAAVAPGDQARALVAEVEAGAAGRWEEAALVEGVLAPGTTLRATVLAVERVKEPWNFLREHPELGPVEKRLAVQVEHAGDAPRIALALDDVAAGREETAPEDVVRGERPPSAPALRHELVLLRDRPELGGAPLALLVPSPFESGAAGAWLVEVAVLGPPASEAELEERRLALEEDRPALEAATQALEASARPVTPEETRARRLASAVSGLGEAEDTRAILLHAASAAGGAPLTTDLALVAEDELLGRFVDALVAAGVPDAAPERLGWELEGAALRFLADQALAGTLPAPLEGVLLRHAGELARSPAVLTQGLDEAAGPEVLSLFLAAEHRLLLDDARPSVRIRAHDWLAARRRAPAGYDPLGPREERRALLAEDERRRAGSAPGDGIGGAPADAPGSAPGGTPGDAGPGAPGTPGKEDGR